jgi:hypothetical protein
LQPPLRLHESSHLPLAIAGMHTRQTDSSPDRSVSDGVDAPVRLCFARSAPSPWQQLVDSVDAVIGDAGEDVAEIGFRIEAVEGGGLGNGAEDGSMSISESGAVIKPSTPSATEQRVCRRQ